MESAYYPRIYRTRPVATAWRWRELGRKEGAAQIFLKAVPDRLATALGHAKVTETKEKYATPVCVGV